MARSMTAFASAQRQTPQGVLECELRAVNHRFLELSLRLPEEVRVLEPALRTRISARVSRGKLELMLRLRPQEGAVALELNQPLVQRLAALMQELQGQVPGARTQLVDVLQFPGVLQAPSGNADGLGEDVLALLDEVLDDFLAAREREGAHLSWVIIERMDLIETIITEIRLLLPQIRAQQRTRLEARLADLSHDGDQGRLEQELVLALQKLDVDEELDRLESHFAELHRVLGRAGPIGRRLDFLLQECNREANTLGSKSVDFRTAQAVVEIKVLLDQIREQAQNVE